MSGIVGDGWLFIFSDLPLAVKLRFFNTVFHSTRPRGMKCGSVRRVAPVKLSVAAIQSHRSVMTGAAWFL